MPHLNDADRRLAIELLVPLLQLPIIRALGIWATMLHVLVFAHRQKTL